jgi:hypothetical protein
MRYFTSLALLVALVVGSSAQDRKPFVFTEVKKDDGYDPNKPVPPGHVWQKVGSEPWKLVKSGASEVAPAMNFLKPSGLQYNASHNCPKCGKSEFRVSGPGPALNTHTHTCTSCGSSWYH